MKIDGTYYDPSYGKTYSSLQDMSDQVIAGYWIFKEGQRLDEARIKADLNDDGDQSDQVTVAVYQIQENRPGQPHKLIASYSNY